MTRRTAAALVALGTARTDLFAQASAPETWEGQILLGGNWRYLEGNLGGTEPPKIDQPQQRGAFGGFEATGDRLQWTLARGPAVTRFVGQRSGSVIRGTTELDGVAGEFQLVRTDRRGTLSATAVAGTYQTTRNDLLSVARYDFGDGVERLALMDAQSGHWGSLLPTGPSQYVLAPARSGRFPADITVSFQVGANGSADRVTVREGNREVSAARRIDAATVRSIEFSNGSIRLAGDLLLPTSAGKHPGIVMIHSSGNQSRNGPVAYFRLIANLLAAKGFAVLTFDKRGVGGSTGSWQSASFDDLAGDVTAAVATLRRQPEVDAARVGLWTLSQGGWIAPIVASRDPSIAFLSLVSAAAITPARQEIDRVAMVMKANGSAKQDIEAAGAYLRTFFDVVLKAKPFSALQAAMADTRGANWLRYVSRPQNENQLGWTPDFAGFDPQPLLRKLAMPVLTLHGEDDIDVDASVNSAIFKDLVASRRSRQMVLKRSDHYMLTRVSNPDRETRRLAPDYLKGVANWLAQL